jgi:Flp pilus assembly protein TadB
LTSLLQEGTAAGNCNAPFCIALLREILAHAGELMKFLSLIGIAFIVLWAILWLGVKMAVGAIHLLLILGVVMVIWGFVAGNRAARS